MNKRIILVAGFKCGAELFFFTAPAQVVPCVHMNDAKRSNSNINDKDLWVRFSLLVCGNGSSGDSPVRP